MSIVIKENIDYIYESTLYLTIANNNDIGVFYNGPEKLTEMLMENYDVPREVLDKMFVNTHELYNHMKMSLQGNEALINKYFNADLPHSFTIGTLLFLFCHGDEHDIDDFVNKMHLMSKDEKLRTIDMRVRLVFDPSYAPTSDDTSDLNESMIYDFISEQDVSDSIKWKLSEFVRKFDEYQVECAELIKRTIQSFRNKQDCIDRMIEVGLENIRELVKTPDIDSGFKEYYHMALDFNSEIIIYPQVVTSNGISLMSDHQGVMNLYVSTLYDQVTEITEKYSFNTEMIAKDIKVLGDKRKFEILCKLREGPMYGQEIAESMDLTTATVSHHMSQLLERELVVIEKADHRIYYAINNEQIVKIVKSIEKLFLNTNK